MWRWITDAARRARTAVRNALISISDPNIARLFGLHGSSLAGVDVTERTALGLSAMYRAIVLISGTLAQLPMRTLRETDAGMRQRLRSFLDNPGMYRVAGAPFWMTPFVWKQTVLAHLVLHNDAFLKHIYGGAGQLMGLQPIHPLSVQVYLPRPGDARQPAGGKWFRVVLDNGDVEVHDGSSLTHVMGFTVDGVRGVSLMTVAGTSLGTAIAGDRAAAKMFSSGAAVAGIVSPDDDWADGDAKKIKADVADSMTGWENAGGIAVVNRRLKFTQLSLSAVDAQFLESRQFSVEEVARWTGVPPFELMQTDKQTSWGTGIEAQQRGLGRTTLAPWATRLEEALSGLLFEPRFVEFDFTALERPSPDREIDLIISQWQAGLLTRDEARAELNRGPLPGGEQTADAAAAPAPAPAGDGVPTDA